MEKVATASVPCDIADLALADAGRRRIDWASLTMPVLRTVRKQFIKTQPFAGVQIAASLHVTAETANLMITLRDGGASPVLCASNPLSTQDDVAAALVRDFSIPVYAIRGASPDVFADHRHRVLQGEPRLLIDSGGDLGALWLSVAADRPTPAGVVEETAAGTHRYNTLDKAGTLSFPVIAANDGRTRSLFDNTYGTGQSTFESREC
jgi:adenosylhomocysteinase